MKNPARGEAAKARRRRDDRLAGRIVDTAMDLAEEVSWEAVRLHRVAERLNISLADVSAHFRDLDGDTVICPWHATIFDVKSGEPMGGPGEDSVPTYEVRVEGDDIQLAKP